MARINNSLEFICENVFSDADALIEKAEIRYKNIIETICEKIITENGNEIVMLAGPSSSGKTTTAGKIKTQLEKEGHKAYIVSLDDFYLNPGEGPFNEDGTPDYESVYALDIPLIEKCLKELIENGESKLPHYDFMKKKRFVDKNLIKLQKGDVTIVEGLHALNPVITDNLPQEHLFKIYVSVSSRIYDKNRHIVFNKRNLRFIRRLVRDYRFRDSSPENTFELWKSVQAGEDKYLFPYRHLADARINSIHIYEPCVFKRPAIELLESLPKDSIYKKDANRLIRNLEKFPELPTDKVPSDSLLRDFVGPEI